MISYIEILLIIFLIVLAVALAVAVYRPKEENVPPIVIPNSNKPGKRKNQRVKPYRKWEKKMNQKKGKNTMLKAEYVGSELFDDIRQFEGRNETTGFDS